MEHLHKAIWALALLVPFFSHGQERLEPYAFASEYDHQCIEKLVAKEYDVFYMRQPSFGVEGALTLRHSYRPGVDAWLVYSEAEESIWYAKKRHRVKTTKHEIAVSADVARRIRAVVNHAINTASPWADPRMIEDGIGYYYCNIFQGAWSHSPKKGVRTYRLAQAMDSICHAVIHADTALLLRQMPLLDSLDRCFRQDYPLEAFYPDFSPNTYTDSTGVVNLQFYRSATFLNHTAPDTLTAQQLKDSLLPFYQQLAREVFVRYPDGVKLSVMVDANCAEPQCKVITRKGYYDNHFVTYYTLTIPPSMLTIERCLGVMELPEGEHMIK